jgi:hypothetical protein
MQTASKTSEVVPSPAGDIFRYAIIQMEPDILNIL